jgi:hypothetical protein
MHMFSAECQQLMVDVGELRSFHRSSRTRPAASPGRIKLMKDDAPPSKQADDIRRGIRSI